MVVAMAAASNAVAAPPKTADALVHEYGAGERARIERGLRQMQELWRPSDGDAAAFDKFAREAFTPTGPALDGVLVRFREALEALDGHFLEISRALGRRLALDVGPVTPLDERFGSYEPAAHL